MFPVVHVSQKLWLDPIPVTDTVKAIANKSGLALKAGQGQVIACSPCLPQEQLLYAFWVCLWCVLMKTAVMQLCLFFRTVHDDRV